MGWQTDVIVDASDVCRAVVDSDCVLEVSKCSGHVVVFHILNATAPVSNIPERLKQIVNEISSTRDEMMRSHVSLKDRALCSAEKTYDIDLDDMRWEHIEPEKHPMHAVKALVAAIDNALSVYRRAHRIVGTFDSVTCAVDGLISAVEYGEGASVSRSAVATAKSLQEFGAPAVLIDLVSMLQDDSRWEEATKYAMQISRSTDDMM